MGAGGHPPGAEHQRSGRDQERKERVHAETEHVAAVEAPKPRKGHSTGPAERSERPEGPTGQDSSVIER